ncbi:MULTISPECIES: hypothetical protein [unclassified Pseudomonas]|uniref:hypothetical protein n=1 Tax=unclassified Pseudomonas TaxID=196821 RepID=UPI000A1FBF23|nr:MULTISPECIES: hypothetical protein [unclassified Pseudomonas]
MSPHILIDKALDGVNASFAHEETGLLVQQLITRLFTDGAITIDEFNHYCKRLRDVCQQRKGTA